MKHNLSHHILPSKTYITLLFQNPAARYTISDYNKFIESNEKDEMYTKVIKIADSIGIDALPYIYTYLNASTSDQIAFARFYRHYMKQSDMEITDNEHVIDIITSAEHLVCFIFVCQYFFL